MGGGEKIGLFGGSFDPVHLGHLLGAQEAYEGAGLTRVYFIPAGQNPHKPDAPGAPGEHRLAMLQRAVAGDPRFGVLDLELHAGGPSYTVDSARALARRFDGASLFWVIGADQLAALDRWHRAAELADLVEFICLHRPGFGPERDPGREGEEAVAAAGGPPAGAVSGADRPPFRIHHLGGRAIEISSTEIRERLRRALPCGLFLPPGVAPYIDQHQLYRQPETAETYD